MCVMGFMFSVYNSIVLLKKLSPKKIYSLFLERAEADSGVGARGVRKLFAVENTYCDTNQTDKTGHKEIASPSPTVL